MDDRTPPRRTRALPTVSRWAQERLALGRSGLLALAGALVVLAGSALVFAAMLEDVMGHDGITLRDGGVDQAIADHRTPGLVDAAKLLTNAGGIGVLAAGAFALLAVLWFRRLRLAVAVAPLVSLGVAAASAAALKGLVGRARPDLPIRLLTETEPSFPSGHATDSTAFFVSVAIVLAVVVLRRPLARALTLAAGFAVPAVIGLTRLELGVHWPSDVIAGWALGTFAAVAVTTTLVLLSRLPDAAGPGRTRLHHHVVRLLGARRSTSAQGPAGALCAPPLAG